MNQPGISFSCVNDDDSRKFSDEEIGITIFPPIHEKTE